MEKRFKNKILILTLGVAVCISVVFTAYAFIQSICNLDGKNVCVDRNTRTFQIEKGASVVVDVENETMGNYLVTTWNETHPNHQNAVSYVVKPALSLQAMKEGFSSDVVSVSQDDAAYFMPSFFDLGRHANSLLGVSVPALLQDSINAQDFKFVANWVDGPVFVYNKTLMEKLGFATTDTNNSGLPDQFESWDAIMKASPQILEKINVVFPLTFEDQNMFYPFLTGGRWTLNFTKNGSNPEFSSNEFYEGLNLIEAMGKSGWDKTSATITHPETPKPTEPATTTPSTEGTPVEPVMPPSYHNQASSLKWQYESAFFEGQSLFSIVTDFNLFKLYEEKTGSEYVYAPFPSYKDHRLTPNAVVSGYMVNAKTKYPSAAAEAIRILRTPAGASLFNKTTGKIPVYHRNHLENLTIENKHDFQRVLAYGFSDTMPVMALNKNATVPARRLYQELDLMTPLKALFNGTKSAKDVQAEIKALSDAWILKNDIIKED